MSWHRSNWRSVEMSGSSSWAISVSMNKSASPAVSCSVASGCVARSEAAEPRIAATTIDPTTNRSRLRVRVARFHSDRAEPPAEVVGRRLRLLRRWTGCDAIAGGSGGRRGDGREGVMRSNDSVSESDVEGDPSTVARYTPAPPGLHVHAARPKSRAERPSSDSADARLTRQHLSRRHSSNRFGSGLCCCRPWPILARQPVGPGPYFRPWAGAPG